MFETQTPLPISISEHLALAEPKIKAFRSKEKISNSLTDSYKQIVNDFEQLKPANINIVNVAQQYGVQYRRVYDLFNLLTSLGVCQNVERGKLAWIGLSSVPSVISKAYAKIEIASLHKPMNQVFCLGQSPSLGMIATHFISMYLYFNVDTLLLRQVSSTFHDPRTDIKSLERRMYLVLSFLEIMGVVAHTMKTNEYKLILDLSAAKESALQQKRKYQQSKCPLSLENLLNSVGGPFTTDLQAERGRDYQLIRC
ncbi:hypothetical protein TVAG_369870 [Trichomonas vaginalis G3]|uniref:E2F/DP family winged-helix DNA-binding domain-containing protein n=1 Tax=Trichomonas vaginalis (strain ATCC PRA-98 / G3) TaxID=412133 RepID=A2EX39_TRIV3|nr:e2F-like (mammalian transcription factor) family [Trichomonas vaginalis G3]EAY02759.1 hypothetical protein TVAG_369870 [Trichomonas vaginalis G3]KAI5500594.1 e2F-like (mammalian transcription factor) family [Trichomonas vaginalis G3]|eukprot:XP_001314982.1 hypothetical protein [Trichomonas vaginalis G3]